MCGFSVETDLVGSPLCMVLQSCMMCDSLDSVGTPSSGTGHGSWVMGCVMFWDTVIRSRIESVEALGDN